MLVFSSAVHISDSIFRNQLNSFMFDQITGGTFSNNMAEFGGFLHKEGAGETSCKGASIQHNRAADGGAMHVVDGATVDWACDIRSNTAITGGAM